MSESAQVGDMKEAHGKPAAAHVYDHVKEYYGKILKQSSDLKSNACVPSAKPIPVYIRKALTEVHPDVTAKYYGCGLAVPECVEGCRMLDLGCGSGRDCYVLSQLVGESGHVTGLDMTEHQLEVARIYIDYHMEKFGYKVPNVNFIQGYIETLREAGLKDNSYDIIISNCVVNLSPDKASVLNEAYHVLKEGGELYFSDVYSNAPISESLRANKVLWGECLSGALWWEDLVRLAEEVGFCKPRLVTASVISVGNQQLENLLAGYKFVSATYRLFKIPKSSKKEQCFVMYDGNITGSEEKVEFDAHYTFKVNEVMEVDGDLANILKNSRFAEEFTFRTQAQSNTKAGACCSKPKVMPVNPFDLAEQLVRASVASSTGLCCGPRETCCM
ncbi:arsenite methyltransferase isoform 2-T2 [Clarias gariepinus]|uniref:arsenite methyltransferase isoform X1 n=1 Tax=Clarias gariepinus TaxID=13013 RepID=UPI00234DA0A1|nr:arsenite methyltransferase isoform X1 [Clarias gariepinus]XP_053333122.1 arsenite methyltransferase isoform X2 [Clarias gariepinus]